MQLKLSVGGTVRWGGDLASTLLQFVCLLLFYAFATAFKLYHSSDMMYEMRRRKPAPTLFTDSEDL